MNLQISHAVRMHAAVLFGILSVHAASGQSADRPDLVHALQGGGQVIVMRHASSPQTPPPTSDADPANIKSERQLDKAGIAAATAMGDAIERLHIPLGPVYSSPAFRAMQTVRFARLGNATATQEIGDRGKSMSAADATQSQWLRDHVKQFVRGKNVFIVTHMPNISAAFPDQALSLQDGEALVFGPDGSGGAKLIARVKIDE